MGNKKSKPSGSSKAPKNKTKKGLLQNSLKPDDFELIQVVGRGAYGKVFQVRKKDTGQIYAMKVLKKDQILKRRQVAHTQTERRILESIDHPFIVSLRYAFQTPDKLYMVSDFFTGGELFFHLKQRGHFSEELARFYCAELCLALQCLHSHDIIYRDLKPENVLLEESGHIRLTDFGLSKEGVTETNLTHTFCGTPEYLAPEVIQGHAYGKEVDLWSLGTLTYEMLTGLPPFYNTNINVMYEKITRAQLVWPQPGGVGSKHVPSVSSSAQDFVSLLLQREPSKRLGTGPRGYDEIRHHPWFAGLDWDALIAKQITPPFIPPSSSSSTNGDGSSTNTDHAPNVDDTFKNATIADTPVQQNQLQQRKVNFPGFSYQEPNAPTETELK